MSADPRLVLRRTRQPGEVVRDALRLYGRNFWTMLALAAAIVVPVQLVVAGLGLERLFAEYDPTPSPAHQLIDVAATILVIAPLLAASTAHALIAAERGELRGPGPPLLAGLEAFTPLFAAVTMAALAVSAGLVFLILPGIYLSIRLYFVPQAVVLDGRRGTDALARSWELVAGLWWRTLGVALLYHVAAALTAALLIGSPFNAAADAADSAALLLAGNVLTLVLFGPFVAIAATLLYFDLRARKEGAAQVEQTAPEPPLSQDLERPEAPAGRRD